MGRRKSPREIVAHLDCGGGAPPACLPDAAFVGTSTTVHPGPFSSMPRWITSGSGFSGWAAAAPPVLPPLFSPLLSPLLQVTMLSSGQGLNSIATAAYVLSFSWA